MVHFKTCQTTGNEKLEHHNQHHKHKGYKLNLKVDEITKLKTQEKPQTVSPMK